MRTSDPYEKMDENAWLEDDYHNKPFIYKDPY